MSRTQRAINGTLASFLQYGLQVTLQIVLVPLVLRFAGQQTLGAFAVVSQTIGYLALLDLGFSVALSRYASQAQGFHDQGVRFGKILTTGRTFLLASNTVYSLAIIILAVYIGPLLKLDPAVASDARVGMFVLAAWSALRTPAQIYSAGLIAAQDLAARNLIGILSNMLRLGSSLGLVACGYGLVGLMLGSVISEAFDLFICAVRFRRVRPTTRIGWGLPDQSLFVEMFKFGAQAMLINIAIRLVFFTDHIIVGTIFGALMASIYYTTQMPAMLGWTLINRVVDNATPALNELYAQGARDRLREVFLRLHRYNMLLVLPFAVGVILLYHPAIRLWAGEEQFGGILMTYCLAVFAVILTVAHVSNAIVMATGRIKTLSILALLEGVMNLILSVALAYTIGLGGVMLATVLANLPTSIYLQSRAMRELDVRVREFLSAAVTPVIAPLVAATLVLLIVTTVVSTWTWPLLIGSVCAFMAVYGIVSALTLPRSDRELIRSYARHLLVFLPQLRHAI